MNLHEDAIDVAVRIGALPDSSLIATRVGTIRQVVCGSPDYFAEKGTPKSPGELRYHDCVTFDGLMSPADWKFMVDGSLVTVAVHSRLVVSTAEAAIDAATMSLGVTRVLSYQAADAMRTGRLALALEEFEPAPWPVNLVYAGQGLLPLKVRAFLDFVPQRVKARLLDETKAQLINADLKPLESQCPLWVISGQSAMSALGIEHHSRDARHGSSTIRFSAIRV